ncbi:MAG: carbonic anhydrase [Leptolyngbya sp.]|nr:carbonic anhydrase [Leptolyngbya sp.]
MKKLIKGLRQFQSDYVPSHQALMKELSKGQHPRVLFIACSDSRVDPALITQSEIGDLFVIRNAGNIIPPYEATNGGEGATIEYAIEALGIKQVIICGHTKCGAMKGLLQVGELEDKMPLVYTWLRHTEATRKLVYDNYGDLDKADLLDAMVGENVLTQIDNLRTYPVIRSRLHRGDLAIHAWIYNIENGSILAYDKEQHAFVPPYSKIDPDRTLEKQAQQATEPRPSYLPGGVRLSRAQAERIYRGSAAR